MPKDDDDIISRPSPSSAPNSLPVFIPCPPLPIPEPLTGEKAIHSGFMRDALDMARLALVTNETPVGCVLVYDGKVIAKGMNATNITRNGTRHAELMAISALLSYSAPPHKPAPDAPASESRRRKRAKRRAHANKNNDDTPAATEEEKWGDVDPKDGHLYPYGQKLHPAPRVDPSVISECVLYVTVEPCVMCASLLRQLRIRKVFFGAVNDKFGGTGGVFRIHMNAGETVPETAPMASAPPSPRLSATNGMARPSLEPRAMSCNGQVDGDSSVNGNKDKDFQLPKRAPTEQAYLGGHGGNVEPGYEAEGGWGRDEAVTLLRQFYVQENGRAPIPRKKEGRAARLALMLERDGHAGGPMIPALLEDEETAPPSPSSSAADPVSPVDMDEA
ncbi:cytidine deaminase-like protein [Coniochaeta sp. 2T2.1]|nr:cytidine deaminase-like protein [Coniochaeta sp. 2T2.1]